MTSVLICPECAAENPLDAENCLNCQAPLDGIEPSEVTPTDGVDQNEEDFLPPAEEDLTDLIHSLRQDDDLSDLSMFNQDDLTSSPEDAEEIKVQAEDDAEPDVPDWLNRIRQRAQSEMDSVGEVTQKIRTARESLEEDKKEDQRRQYESVIEKIHRDEGEPIPTAADQEGESLEESRDQEGGDPDWLARIRQKQAPQAEEEQRDYSEREGDSLLQWLVALEDGVEESEGDTEPDEEKLDKTVEDTQEVPISSAALDATQEITVGKRKPTRRKASVLSISREEQSRADQLTATILDEKAPRPLRTAQKAYFPQGIRLVIVLLLIAILSLALFYRVPADLPGSEPAPQNLAVLEWAEALPAEATLLFVLDYQAAFSAELELIAQPVLEVILRDSREISILSSTPAGGLLFDRLVDTDLQAESMQVRDLGYYPVGAFGAYGLAHQVQSGWQIRNQPGFTKALPTEPFAGIVILGDDYEGAMAWIEQLSSLMPSSPIVLLVSAQAEPLLLPYWESGQVVGMIGGMADAVKLGGQTSSLPNKWQAYQMGIVMMILLLLIGASMPARDQHDGEGEDMR